MSGKPKIGPTGQYPFGRPVDPTDRGGLHAGFAILRAKRLCVLEFGTLLEYVNVTISEARTMNTMLRKGIRKEWGDLSYNKTELPIRVRIVHKNLVQITLPRRGSGIVANPEVFLALAEVIEDRLREANLI